MYPLNPYCWDTKYGVTILQTELQDNHPLAAQIRSHMDSHDLGNIFQSAYKVGHSTETALLCIKNEIHLALSKGMPTALVLLDLSLAFDTIDHDTLLFCLSARFGFAGLTL